MNAIFIEDWGKAALAMLNKREFDRFCGLFVRFAIGDEFNEEDKKTRAYKLFESLKIGEKTLKCVQKYEQKCAKTVEKRIKNDEKKIVQDTDTQYTLLGNTKTKTNTITNTNILERENRERLTPTLDEVKELCEKENYDFDPVKFFNHYASYGWKVNGKQLIDWKAMAAKWQATQQEYNNNNKNNNYGRDKNNNDGFSGTGYTGDTI